MRDPVQPKAGLVKVKRDGPRGWHWIDAANFDPAKHVLADMPAATTATERHQPAPAPVRRGPGRPPKHHTPES